MSQVLTSAGYQDSMRDLWALRCLELERLLRAGFGALFFDVDAVWQTDLRVLLGTTGTAAPGQRAGQQQAAYAYDVLASRGSFPNDVSRVREICRLAS
jgi:hypothetical protein